ncbi:phosphodiesterase [Galbitalea sp. SE-J8]|uniref:phosphodiesterase n=1 Tax=Galbitalea sp. SE-J8 TaxID=3054952 RepID=UPI00259CF4ED|nr:phosphodiesterase [Galbitalea sp. SE-J8]MDM4762622.1 phosphodiesterase [Galbitalea sp. SE-J8]
MTRVAEHPRPDHFLLHFSDTHLVGDGTLYDSVDSEAHLRRLLEGVEAAHGRPEAMVFTGDLADRGEPEAYDRLRRLVEPVAERLGTEVVWVMGNHDDRAAFREGLLDQAGSAAPVDRVHWFGGLRLVVLDSTVPGHHHGRITGAQLDWLAEELATSAPHGTILAMHHPPVPSMLDLAMTVELRDQASLAEVLQGTDVRSILAGHLHYSSTALFAGIPVSVASATCYTQDLTVAAGGTRPRDGAQAYNLVHVYDSTVLHSVVPLGGQAALSYSSPAESAAVLAREGIVVPPSRAALVPADAPLTTADLLEPVSA